MNPEIKRVQNRMDTIQLKMNNLMFRAIKLEAEHLDSHIGAETPQAQAQTLTLIANEADKSLAHMEEKVEQMNLHYRVCCGELDHNDLTDDQARSLAHLILEEMIGPDITVVNVKDLATGRVDLGEIFEQ